MANPIQPVGGIDIVESARQQDMERRQREAQDHYDRTGERLAEYREYDPLVPINGYEPPDVASDGDSYGERRVRSDEIVDRAIDDIFGQGYANESRLNAEEKKLREQALHAENRRILQEHQRKKDELQVLREETRKKFNNAVYGLEIFDEE